MNRNATIGVVLVGVLLAAISVGIATYMSKGTIDENAETLRAEMAASASDVDSQIATIEENTVAKENGEAVSLAAVDTLWSKGRLTVTDAAGTGLPLFEVDPEASRIVLGANAIEIGDLTAGAMTSTGVITGEGFQTTSGSWAVDSAGDMKSGDLTVSGDTAVAGILKVNGGELRVGDGFVYDAGAKRLAVVGDIFASGIYTNTGGNVFEMFNDVQFDGSAFAKSGAWNIAQDGTAKFGTLTAGAINAASLTATGAVKGATLASTGDATVGGNLGVTGGATVGGSLAATGDVTAANVTASGTAKAANIIATGTLKTDGDKFTVDVATGNTAIGGTLTVGGANAVPANTTAFWVDGLGAVNVTDLYFDGNLFDPEIGKVDTKNVMGDTITAKTKFTTTGGKFTADAATGNVDLVSLSFSGVPFDPGAGSDPTKDVVGRDLIAYRTLKTSGDKFTVDAATGDTYVGGDLDVAGAASVTGNLTVTGNISAANLPDGMVAGVAPGDGPPISIAGMPANAVAVATALAPTPTPVFVDTTVAGTLTIVGDPAVLYNYIVVW